MWEPLFERNWSNFPPLAEAKPAKPRKHQNPLPTVSQLPKYLIDYWLSDISGSFAEILLYMWKQKISVSFSEISVRDVRQELSVSFREFLLRFVQFPELAHALQSNQTKQRWKTWMMAAQCFKDFQNFQDQNRYIYIFYVLWEVRDPPPLIP